MFDILLSFLLSTSTNNISEPYANLQELLPFDPHSWYNNPNEMENLANETKPKIIIELGSWLGHSTSHLAKLVGDNGKVYAVDHWLGSVEHYNVQHLNKKLPLLYDQFLSNIIHYKQTENIIPIRDTTENAIDYFINNKIYPDIIYVDAAHDEENVYKDISNYYPLVKGRGIICGDDYIWGNNGVKRAVDRFAAENNLTVETSRNCFWILKERKN